MKYLRHFKTLEEFLAVKDILPKPWVSSVVGNSTPVYQNLPTIDEEELTQEAFVDLGLPSSLCWATCNLGASSPCESGKYFQFGGTIGYDVDEAITNSVWENSPFNGGSKTFDYSAFTGAQSKTDFDNYDAAMTTLGDTWKVPTMQQFDELFKETTHQICTCKVLKGTHLSHDVIGILFTSKVNENKLFIPASGYISSKGLHDQNSAILLWARQFATNPGYGRCANLGAETFNTNNGHIANESLPIRAVCNQ